MVALLDFRYRNRVGQNRTVPFCLLAPIAVQTENRPPFVCATNAASFGLPSPNIPLHHRAVQAVASLRDLREDDGGEHEGAAEEFAGAQALVQEQEAAEHREY